MNEEKLMQILCDLSCENINIRKAFTEVLALSDVRLSLPDSEEITEAAMEYAEIDGTTDEYDESVRDASHFVAGATWYHKRVKGNGA